MSPFLHGVNLWVHPMQKGSRFIKDRGLNENQHERIQQDLSDYREQLRQVQVQQQRSPRIGDFGR